MITALRERKCSRSAARSLRLPPHPGLGRGERRKVRRCSAYRCSTSSSFSIVTPTLGALLLVDSKICRPETRLVRPRRASGSTSCAPSATRLVRASRPSARVPRCGVLEGNHPRLLPRATHDPRRRWRRRRCNKVGKIKLAPIGEVTAKAEPKRGNFLMRDELRQVLAHIEQHARQCYSTCSSDCAGAS
jgi:hypothetical protein